MHKKDFEIVALVFRSFQEVMTAKPLARATDQMLALRVLKTVSSGLAYALAKTNPLFDRSRFLTACGQDASTISEELDAHQVKMSIEPKTQLAV